MHTSYGLSAVRAMNNPLLNAAIKLLKARANTMFTEDEWEALAQAIKLQTGLYVQWRTHDELKPE